MAFQTPIGKEDFWLTKFGRPLQVLSWNPDFEQPGDSETGFTLKQGGFGDPGSAPNGFPMNTLMVGNSESSFRKHIILGDPADYSDWEFTGRIDNWVWVYVNGTLVGSTFHDSGNTFTYNPNAGVFIPGDNLIAVRTRSTGDTVPAGHSFAIMLTVTGPAGWSVGQVAFG
jgi:hypothetical protein